MVGTNVLIYFSCTKQIFNFSTKIVCIMSKKSSSPRRNVGYDFPLFNAERNFVSPIFCQMNLILSYYKNIKCKSNIYRYTSILCETNIG